MLLNIDMKMIGPLNSSQVRFCDGVRAHVIIDDKLVIYGSLTMPTACLCLEVHNWRWTPLWCPIRGNGSARPGADTEGFALAQARHKKERTYPELVGTRYRASLVVLVGESAVDGQRKLGCIEKSSKQLKNEVWSNMR